jgi:uncharacterized delta-60 repeat protein
MNPENPLPVLPKIILLLVWLAWLVRADVVVDPGFKPAFDNLAVINALLVQPDSTVIAGGTFSTEQKQNIARLLHDGSSDAQFGGGESDGEIHAITTGDGDAFWISGRFSPGLARLNGEGAIDSAFTLSAGANGTIEASLPLADGGALVGGAFTYFGAASPYLAKIRADGAVDASFASPLVASPAIEGGVEGLATQGDKILVSGTLRTPRGDESLIRLNADYSVDLSFAQNHGAVLYLNAMKVLSDGKILIGGTADSQGRGFLRRLNVDGTVDSSFGELHLDRAVRAIAVDANGRIVAGGAFQTANSESVAGLIRLRADGTIDSGFRVAVTGIVSAVAIDSGGEIYVGGVFGSINGVAANGLVRLVESAPVFHATSLAAGSFHATLRTDPNKSYVIEYSVDLRTWNLFATQTATNVGLEVVDPDPSQNERRFFRARLAE